MTQQLLEDAEKRMQKTREVLERELASIRTSRASPSLVEDLPVDYYGTPTPLKQIASISAPEPRMLMIQPWDRGAIPQIERAISKSDLGISPVADGALLRVPHMGWNEVRFDARHPVLEGLPERDVFYFVHGYRAVPVDARDTVGRSGYGGEFAAAVARENMFAVQFHPEKSQDSGRRLLDRFVAWVSTCA